MAEFADQAELRVQAGSGGNGCASVHREKFKPLGGPDGGNGGRGGDVILKVDRSAATLLDFHRRPLRRAGEGKAGAGAHRSGANGADLVVNVPDGTVVKSPDGEILADLIGLGTEYVAAEGGHGGLGNAALASTKRKAPGFALRGEPGQQADLLLELKTIADVGLVGFPNAWQVLADLRDVGGSAQDRQLPVHDADPAPGRHRGGRHPVRDGRRARPDPGRQRGPGPGPGVPAARRALLGRSCTSSTARPKNQAAIRSRTWTYSIRADRLRRADRRRHGQPARDRGAEQIDVPEARDLAELVLPDLVARDLAGVPVSAATGERPRELASRWRRWSSRPVPRRRRRCRPGWYQVRPVAGRDSKSCGWGRRGPHHRGQAPPVDPADRVQQRRGRERYLADRPAKLGVEEALAHAGAEPAPRS